MKNEANLELNMFEDNIVKILRLKSSREILNLFSKYLLDARRDDSMRKQALKWSFSHRHPTHQETSTES